MENLKINESEYRFCLVMWNYDSVSTTELVKQCQEQLGWKRTTTYTVIKRLGEKGILINNNGLITPLVSKDEAESVEIENFVEKKFGGSFAAFLSAFTKHQNLSESDLKEIRVMIDNIKAGDNRE